MSKLVYSALSTELESNYSFVTNGDQTNNTFFRSVVFTGDGYLYTHGKKFKLFAVTNNLISGPAFSITNGTAQFSIDNIVIGSGNVLQDIAGDSIISKSVANGVATLTHAKPLTALLAGSYGSATAIPTLTVDLYGHITAITTTTVEASKVQASAITGNDKYNLIGVTDNTLQNPGYNTNILIDKNGNLYATTFYQGNLTLAQIFAPLSHTTTYATDSAYGHVKLFDSEDNSKDAASHYAATPKAVSAALASAQTYADNLVAALDSMIFAGTLKPNGVIQSHNSKIFSSIIDGTTNINTIDYKVGYTFRFTEDGTFNNIEVEPGDMLIAVSDKGTSFAIADWTVIQTNITGALTSSAALTGLLYANNSRNISALNFSNGVLIYDNSTLSFVNKNTLWRTIKVNGTSIGTNDLDLILSGAITITRNGGDVTFGVNSATILGSASALTITLSSTDFTYSPSAASTLNIGNMLTLSESSGVYTLSHATKTTITGKLGKITTDGYGHISSLEEVTSLPNPNALKFKANSTDVLSYTGSDETTITFSNGTDITFSGNATNKTISASVTHKYRPVSFKNGSNSASSLLANNSDGTLTLIGGSNITLEHPTGGAAGDLLIKATDTWRDIQAYSFGNNVMSRSSLGNVALLFSDDFIYSSSEIGLTWAEIDANGNITYTT